MAMICPMCAAENTDGAAYCTLCFAPLLAGDGVGGTAGWEEPAYGHPGPHAPLPEQHEEAAQQYVAPGDFRALAQEMKMQGSPAGYGDAAPVMHPPGPTPAARTTAWMPQRSRANIVFMVLGYSLLTLFVVTFVTWLLSLWLLGAAFKMDMASLNFGYAMLFFANAVILFAAGYVISRRAMHPRRGWAYGVACVAAVDFFWGPLLLMALAFLFTGELYLPIFTLAGVLFALFLNMPMGALGGWVAERRYVG